MSKESPSLLETLNAVRVLALAGISDEALGKTIRDYVCLTEFQSVVPLVLAEGTGKRSVSPVVQVIGPTVLTAPSRSPLCSEVVSEKPELVPLKVKLEDGTLTNIVVPRHLLEAVAIQQGGMGSARKLARDFVKTTPRGLKRSGWVVSELSKLLDKKVAEPA